MTATLPGPARSRMRQEIEEQPEALRRTLDALLPAVPDLAVLARDCRQQGTSLFTWS